MNKIHHRKVSNFLSKFNINQLARDTGFWVRTPRKITPQFFILSFFNVMLNKCYSLRQWAVELSLLSGTPVSFQAIAKKLQFRHLPFLKALFYRGMEAQLNKYKDLLSNDVDNQFNRILIEDSTCVKLPDSLAEHFPGSKSQYIKKNAIAKIQLCIDLLSNSFQKFELKSFCNSDATYAGKIMNYIKKDDLILRDLGYAITKIFRQITNAGAFFISRLHPKWAVLDAESEQVIDLVKTLKKLDSQNIGLLDTDIKINKKEKLQVRLVCFKLNTQIHGINNA